MMTGITGYFAFSLVLASSLLSYSPSEANSFSTSIDNNIYSSCPALSDHAEQVATRKTLAANILLLLGTTDQASSVDPATAQSITSCFKYFFTPTSTDIPKFIWSTPIKSLALEATNYVGDPRNFIHSFLNSTRQNIPDADGTMADGQKIPSCQLTKLTYGQSFRNNNYNLYFIHLFNLIADQAVAKVGSTVRLNRYDLFHGHMFLTPGTRRIGIIFHAQEYPTRDSSTYDVPLGACQGGFNVMDYNQNNMNLRNILWLAPLVDNTSQVLAPGVLVALDARPGGIIYEDLVVNSEDYQKSGMAVDPDDFGTNTGDVEYLNVKAGDNAADDYKFYVCASFWNSAAGVASE